MIMPYMDRGSALHLIRLLKEGGVREGLPESWVRYILSEALQGVKYLHDQNLLHRDLKAGNILLDSEGNVRIADFGVSGWLQEGGDRKNNRLTFVGTPCWMAPEVMDGKHACGRFSRDARNARALQCMSRGPTNRPRWRSRGPRQ